MPGPDIFFALARHLRVLFVLVRSLVVVALALSALLASYVLYIIVKRRISAYRSPLRDLPGPERAHWFKGNFVDVAEPNSARLQEEWVRTYGHVLKYHSIIGVCPFFVCFLQKNVNTIILVICSHRNYSLSTLSPSPTSYKTATLSENLISYDSVLVS
jgi:hypothetical protein